MAEASIGARTPPRIFRRRRVMRSPLVSPRLWLRRLVFWVGAVLVSAVAIAFAAAANHAVALFLSATRAHPWLPYILSPLGLVVSLMLTRRVFPGAQGSGIPQTIAAIHMTDQAAIARTLSMKIAVGKIALTLLGLICGASIGREGPTVQIGAAIMHACGRFLRLRRLDLTRALVLAGGAAGIAAAFNTPLAGIVFAIEELSHSFEARTSGTVLAAVIIAGATTLSLVGNYTYFGSTSASLTITTGWIAVLMCSVAGGLLGGFFSWSLVLASRGLPGALGILVVRYPILFAALCGLALAALGTLSGGQTFGTGYDQARALVEDRVHLPATFAVLKLLATVVSYIIHQRHPWRHFRAIARRRRRHRRNPLAIHPLRTRRSRRPARHGRLLLRRRAGTNHRNSDRHGND